MRATAPGGQDRPPTANAAADEKPSYGQILKSSALIGSSSVANIGIGIVRTKAMAVLLGPSGVGLLGLYGSIVDLAQSMAGMGINSSGVRQIAEAAGSGETERIARIVAVLRRTTIFLGMLGAVLLAVFSRPVSTLTFGSDQQAAGVALLSAAVFFRVVSDGQGALIQGMRRIADLAKMGVLGAIFSTIIGILLVFFLGEQGVAPSVVGIAAMTAMMSWWYSRKVNFPTPSLSASQMGREASALLKLGFAFMASGLMMMGAAYAIRIMVLRLVGFEAAGLYQSAWTLGGLYVGFVLQAMGADFYPRLTVVAKDNAVCNRMVNEQAQVSLLLAGPGVIATLAFAPVIIELFYTAEFHAAVDVLRWLCLGMTLRIISWPMGFIIVAKGAQNVFFWSEAVWTVAYTGLAWVSIGSFGLSGAGIAFFESYILHGLMIYCIVRRLSGFRWSSANRRTAMVFLPLITLVFCGFYVLPPWPAIGVGLAAAILSGIYSLHILLNLVSPERIPGRVRQMLGWLGPKTRAATAPGGRAAEDRSPRMRCLKFAWVVYASFCVWIHWYEEVYGWSVGWGAFVPGLTDVEY